MADFDWKDYAVIGGLGLGGAGLGLYSLLKQKEAGEAFKKALEEVQQDAETNPKEYEKLRDISGVDVNIRDVNKLGESFIGKGNAYFAPNKIGFEKNKNIVAKVPGKDGIVALGSENRALPTLAHELGHGKNSKEGKLQERMSKRALWVLSSMLGGLLTSGGGRALIHYLANEGTISPESVKWWTLAPIAAGTAVAGLGGYIGNKYQVEEEAAATRNAIKFLKAYGRLPKELRKDRALLNKALDTYKTGRRSELLGTIGLGGLWSALGYGLSRAFYE